MIPLRNVPPLWFITTNTHGRRERERERKGEDLIQNMNSSSRRHQLSNQPASIFQFHHSIHKHHHHHHQQQHHSCNISRELNHITGYNNSVTQY